LIWLARQVKEEYTMNDRQCGYDDDPLPPGEGRPALAGL